MAEETKNYYKVGLFERNLGWLRFFEEFYGTFEEAKKTIQDYIDERHIHREAVYMVILGDEYEFIAKKNASNKTDWLYFNDDVYLEKTIYYYVN